MHVYLWMCTPPLESLDPPLWYAVYYHMFVMWALQLCIKGFIYCILWIAICLVPWTLLSHILHVVYCQLSCAIGTATSYYCMLYFHVLWALSLCAKDTTASYIVCCALQYCYTFCTNSTAAPYSIIMLSWALSLCSTGTVAQYIACCRPPHISCTLLLHICCTLCTDASYFLD